MQGGGKGRRIQSGVLKSLSRVEMAELVLKSERMSPHPGGGRVQRSVCATVAAAAAWAGKGGDRWMAAGGSQGPQDLLSQ